MYGFNIWLRPWLIGCAVAVVLVAVLAGPAFTETPNVTRVEEDWEMVVGTPSSNSDAPQVTCLISPVGNVDSFHATFVVNHHDVPTYTAGGLQLQSWNGETLLASKRFPNQAVLSLPGETIRWTQTMTLGEEGLVFEVVGGTSSTWGNFGGEGTLKLITSSSLANLNGYSPDVSVKQSGVSYAANRVQSLVLKRVRAYGDSGLLAEDANPRIVHSLNE